VPYEVSTRLCTQPGLASECFGAKKSLHIRPVTPGDTGRHTEGSSLEVTKELGKESDTIRT